MYIDILIIATYLVGTLLYGLYVGKNVKDINDYSLGGRTFSTPVIAATIFATYASSSGFYINLYKGYEDGLYKIIASFGQTIGLFFTAYLIAPRMKEFFGKISAAEMLGSIYGKNIQIIASIPMLFVSSGFLAIQIKVLSGLISHFTVIDNNHAIYATASIIILYSALGGIKAVTLTDFIQFATFGIAVPLIFVVVLKSLDLNSSYVNKELIYQHITHFNPNKFEYYLVLFFYYTTLSLDGPMAQRMLMARDTKQIRDSIIIASKFLITLTALSCGIGIMLKVDAPCLTKEQILPYLLDNYTSTGTRGLFIIGIMALAMSTADSFLNSGSVSFSHDFCTPLGLINEKNELLISKIFTIICGFFGVILAFNFEDVLDLIMLIFSFYLPIVTTPLMLAIFGFRSTEKSVLVGIIFGTITVISWDSLMNSLEIQNPISNFLPGVLAHIFGLFGTHYLFREKGGWGQGPGKGMFNSQ